MQYSLGGDDGSGNHRNPLCRRADPCQFALSMTFTQAWTWYPIHCCDHQSITVVLVPIFGKAGIFSRYLSDPAMWSTQPPQYAVNGMGQRG